MFLKTLSSSIPGFVRLPQHPRGAGEVLLVYRVSPRSDKVEGGQT